MKRLRGKVLWAALAAALVGFAASPMTANADDHHPRRHYYRHGDWDHRHRHDFLFFGRPYFRPYYRPYYYYPGPPVYGYYYGPYCSYYASPFLSFGDGRVVINPSVCW